MDYDRREDAFRDRRQLPQIYHELSHLWNVEDLDHPSPRWNEGLASFLQWRMAAELDGWAEWDARIDRAVRLLLSGGTAAGSWRAVPLVDYGRNGITDASYSTGMLMFHVLDQLLGADRFDQCYRRFYQRYRGPGATGRDLADSFHLVDARADAVFADWFFTARWYARLAAGESLQQMIESYRRR